MKKDIEWLKGRLRMRKLFKPQTEEEIGYNKAIDEFSEYVDQLEEQETLSSDWIDENKKYNDVHDIGYYIPVDRLYGKIVPKQGLPVIPEEVGERIEREINLISLYQSLNYAYNYAGVGEVERKLDEWVIENTEEYVQAWLNGFTVEKHPILLAKIKGWEQFVDFVGAIYWGTDDDTDRLTFVDRDQALALTKKDWEQLGISEKNADFVNPNQ